MSNKTAWALLIISLPTHPANARLRAWRALKGLGCAVLRDGAYLLPNDRELTGELEAVGADIIAADGMAHLLTLNARDEGQQQMFESLFDRSDDYGRLVVSAREAGKSIAGSEPSSLTRAVNRLKKEFEAISERDFFPGSAREQALAALDDVQAAASLVISPDEPHPSAGRIRPLKRADYQGRTWATRKRPWVDRLASAWLIQRFIDPAAKFIWLVAPKDCPKKALGFDFDDAAFTHIGAKVTFEVLAESFGLADDAALERIGALVHYLDVGGIPVPEAAGLELLLSGLQLQHPDDNRLLAEASKLFDALYAAQTREKT